MTITQFKKLLARHGADISRWDGVDVRDVENFIQSSDQARTLMKEEQALDNALASYTVDHADPALLDTVMARIGGEISERSTGVDNAASIQRLRPHSKAPVIRPPVLWGGALAVAAAIILFIAAPGTSPQITYTPNPGTVETAANDRSYEEEIDRLATETVEEEIARQEIMGLLILADASESIQGEQEIDQFLNELFSDTAPVREPREDPGLQQEMDLWELFLASENDTRGL